MKKTAILFAFGFISILLLLSARYSVSFYQAAGNVGMSDLLTCEITYLSNGRFALKDEPLEPHSDVYQEILSALSATRYKPLFLANILEDHSAYYDGTGNMIVLQYQQAKSVQHVTVILGLEDVKSAMICGKDYRILYGPEKSDALFVKIAEIASVQIQEMQSDPPKGAKQDNHTK